MAANRHRAALDALALKGNETILEIGCGQGVATRLILEVLTSGRIVALDRSARMAAALAASAPEAIAAGRLQPRAEALEAADFGAEQFDAIVAINVDLNLRLAERWPDLLDDLLKPDGRLVLVLQGPPGSDKAEGFATLSRQRLQTAGFAVTLQPSQAGMVVIIARR